MKSILFIAALATLTLTSCNSNRREVTGLMSASEVHMAIDETFRPIMEEEISVFNARYSEAMMMPEFMTETEAINLLLKDSIRFILTTRSLSEAEQNTIKNNKLAPQQRQIASDAVALVVNNQNPDTLITLDEIKGIMTGKITRWEQLAKSKNKGEIEVVFDNANSSTVRYIQDSICGSEAFTGNLKAQKTNTDVLDYIKKSPLSIGVVGADWVKNPSDTSLISFDPSVRVMRVSRFSGSDASYFHPYQYYIATGEYPLTRSVFAIMTDPFTMSMTRKFFYFLSDTEGQLIITKSSQLLPIVPVQVKNVRTTN